MLKNMDKKTAIILFNLGGPDKLTSVRPFLFNLFSDQYIINLPKFLRYPLAWLISSLRASKARDIYRLMGGKSTILEETKAQADGLKKKLRNNMSGKIEIFISMRHWHPKMEEVIDDIEKYQADEMILVPLYPQFSISTTLSSIEDFLKLKSQSPLKDKTHKIICCYPIEKDFIKAHLKLLQEKIALMKNENYKILFSAHGIPKSFVKRGDPYQYQIEKTVEKIVEEGNISQENYLITYQSKVGPAEWLKPSTEEIIKDLAEQKINLIIVPIAFVSEHSETLVELDIEYKEMIKEHNIYYLRVPTLSIEELYIKSLSEMIINFSKKEKKNFTASSNFTKLCPKDFSKCPCNLK
jgi:ferrochelatase